MEQNTTSKELKLLDVRLKVVDNLLRVYSSKIQSKLSNKERENKCDLFMATQLPSVKRFNKTDKRFFRNPVSEFTNSDKNFNTTNTIKLK
jgi:hypothetical protein